MALLNKQRISLPFLTPAFVPAGAGGDTFEPGDNTFFVVKNGGAGNMNVTFSSKPDTTEYGAAIPDHVTAVVAGTERWFGPMKGSIYADPVTGLVNATYSDVTSVNVGVFRI